MNRYFLATFLDEKKNIAGVNQVEKGGRVGAVGRVGCSGEGGISAMGREMVRGGSVLGGQRA